MMRKQRSEKIHHTASTTHSQSKTHYQTRCEQNPACCSKRNALCFAKTFKPPLIGPQKEFCNQAVGRGIPVPNCELGKPVTFIYPRSIFYGLEPASKPGSSPQLKNWKKWCTIWHTNQAALRDKEIPPPLMTCSEGWRRKLEDVELVDRTIHTHHLDGFNLHNLSYPNSIGPGKECRMGIQEQLTRRYFRDYPPMEKIRIPKQLRKEMHLPQRRPPQQEGKEETAIQYWKWEQKWSNSKYLQETKADLRADFEKQVPLQTCPDKLIVQGKSMPGLGGPKAKRKGKSDEFGLAHPIPQLIFTQEADGPLYQSNYVVNESEIKIPPYEDKRGPVLYVEGRTFQVLLKKQLQTNPDEPLRENQFLYDLMDGFGATTRCKEVRYIFLKNQGTTAIRFQWLRSPPSSAIRHLLANPGKILHLNDKKPIAPSSANMFKTCEHNEMSKKKVSIHLTTSRRVDPALTRTLKVMGNCATAELAYENLLLMLAFRVPRLRKLLVRRTGRQLKRRKLPLHVQQLYLKLKQKQRVERKRKEVTEKSESPITQTSRESFGFPTRTTEEEGEVDNEEEVCTCPPCSISETSRHSSEEDYFADMSGTAMNPRTDRPNRSQRKSCKCSEIKPKYGPQIFQEIGPEDEVMGENYIPGPDMFDWVDPDKLNLDSDKTFTGGFECIGEWQEIEGEAGEGDALPTGASSSFYPLGYGKSLVQEKKKTCRGKLVPEMNYIAKPKKSVDGWINMERESVSEGPNPLRSTSSEEVLHPEDPVFKELKGYRVRRKYDKANQKATVEIGLDKKRKSLLLEQEERPGEWLEDGLEPRLPVIPLRPTQKTHRLNTQSLEPSDFERLGLKVEESLDKLDLSDFEYERPPGPFIQNSSRSSLQEEEIKKITPPPKEKVLEILKDPCCDFHFRELPGVLLPGQTAKFPIIFRPRKPGFYFETLYLVTHPRLCEATYAVRLNGLCMDPDLPTEMRHNHPKGRKGSKTVSKRGKLENLESEIQEEMLKRQGRDLLEAIIDNVFYLSDVHKDSVPFGKVTTESIFYAHNPNLFYHHGIAEDALKTIRSLVSHTIPKNRILDNSICPLNIESLYKELGRPDAEYLWPNFKSSETEEMLTQLNDFTKILTKPNAMNAIPLSDQKFNASYYFLLTIIDEVSYQLVSIEQSYETPELINAIRASIVDKIHRQQAKEERKRQREELKRLAELAELGGSSGEEEGKSSGLDKVDVGTQKDLNDPPPPEPDVLKVRTPSPARKRSKGKVSGKSPKGKKGKKGKTHKEERQNSKETEATVPLTVRTPSLQADTEKVVEMEEDENEDVVQSVSNQEFLGGNRLSRASQTLERRPSSFAFEKLVDEEYNRFQNQRAYQSKRVVFENVLSMGIERMMGVIDNMKNMYHYKSIDYIAPQSDSDM